MLNDPEFDKMIIYGLAGVCLVLLLAVIFLAVKKNIYYVDEDGREVPSPKAVRKVRKTKKTKEEPVPVQEALPEPEPEIVSEPEPEPAPALIPEPAVIPAAVITPEEVREPVYEAPAEEPEPAEIETEAEEAEEEPVEDDVDVMLFNNPEVFSEEDEESISIPAYEEDAPVVVRSFNADDDFTLGDTPEEPEEEVPASLPRPSGLVVTVTVGGQSQTHEIDTLPCLIGREQTSCDLVISEPAVSRRHARFYAGDDSIFIEDVSEHNGTYLNGTKLPSLGSAPLSENDRISLGRAEIAVVRILY